MDDAQLYTLRIWHHAGQWRAAVRAVGDDHARLFTAPEPLAAWLRAGGSDAPVPAPPVQGPGDDAVEGQVQQRKEE